MDVFKIGGCIFLLIESGRIKYVEILSIDNSTMATIIPLVMVEMAKYKWRGLQSTGIHIEKTFNNDEFEAAVRPAILHKYASNEHVAIAEQRNRTAKERICSIVAGLPYKVLPKVLVRGIVKQVKM